MTLYKKNLLIIAVGLGLWGNVLAAPSMTKVRAQGLPEPEVLQSIPQARGNAIEIVRDASGRVYKRIVGPDAPAISSTAKVPAIAREPKTEQTFYEGFEGYKESFGLNWIPDGWSKINTDVHTPTAEQLSHNINNSWYVYYSSDFFQQMTPDGLSEAFIHFGYDGNYGSSDAAQDEWLVTPEITLGEKETLSFMLQCDYSSVYEWDFTAMKFKDRSVVECNMKVMLTEDGGQTWQCIWDLEADEVRNCTDRECYYTYGDMMYHEFSTPLNAYAGKTVKLAFRYERVAGRAGNSMMIDGVTITHPSDGSDPWTLLGKATIADGWVTPALTKNPGEFYNPADYTFSVDVYESDETPGVYKLSSPYTSAAFPFRSLNANSEEYDIIIDASNPDFVIVEPQNSGFVHADPGAKALRYAVPYYISCAGKYFLDEGNSIEAITSYGYASTFDPETGVITIVVPQYGHEKADGSLDMGYACSDTEAYPTVVTLPGHGETPETWNAIGKAIYVDGFLYPGYFGHPQGYGWEVAVEENANQPGLYRIVNPYTCDESPMAYFNSNSTDTYVVIDATDPAIVVLRPQYSGFSAYTEGELWDFYIGNIVGNYVNAGTAKEILLEYLSEQYVDKLENGVITFKQPLFGSNAGEDFGYQWQDENGEVVQYAAKLYLPGTTEVPEDPIPSGIESIETDTDAPAVYYTPTGVRLNGMPNTPGIYIRVSAGRATKLRL